jgi:hypothetical protein
MLLEALPRQIPGQVFEHDAYCSSFPLVLGIVCSCV